jgi:hypothetical protein
MGDRRGCRAEAKHDNREVLHQPRADCRPLTPSRQPTATSVLMHRSALPSGRRMAQSDAMATLAALRTVALEDSLGVGMRGSFAAARYILTPAFPSEPSTAIITLVPLACLC